MFSNLLRKFHNPSTISQVDMGKTYQADPSTETALLNKILPV